MAEMGAGGAAPASVPVVWLVGKAQAGKTSIAARLIGSGEDGIGAGFDRTTREPCLHPWPAPPAPPLFQFLDTPGLGAPGADEEAEARTGMAQAEDQAHLLLVAVRADDADLDGLLAALRTVRQRHPAWPIVVAQTRLHDLYVSGGVHPVPYPFRGNAQDDALPGVPADLRRALALQREAFRRLPGAAPVFVPIDLTLAEQALEPCDYGAERLMEVLGERLPDVVDVLEALSDPLRGARLTLILPYALAAAASEAPPLPLVGLLGATTVQGLMLRAIASRFDLAWNRDLAWRFVAVLGPGLLVQFGGAAMFRQILKMVPGIGTGAAAASAFAVTWAAGEAAMSFFAPLSRSSRPPPEAVRQAWRAGFREALSWMAQRRRRPPGV